MATIDPPGTLYETLVDNATGITEVRLTKGVSGAEALVSRKEGPVQASLWARPLVGATRGSRVGNLPGLIDIPLWDLSDNAATAYRIVATQPGSAGSGLVVAEFPGTQVLATAEDRLGVYESPRFAKSDDDAHAGAVTAVASASEPPTPVMFCRSQSGDYRRCGGPRIATSERLMDLLLLASPCGRLVIHKHRSSGEGMLDQRLERTGPSGERLLPGRLLLSRVDAGLAPIQGPVDVFPQQPVYGWDAVMDDERIHVYAATTTGSLHATLACKPELPTVSRRFQANDGLRLDSPSLLRVGEQAFFAALTSANARVQVRIGAATWRDL